MANNGPKFGEVTDRIDGLGSGVRQDTTECYFVADSDGVSISIVKAKLGRQWLRSTSNCVNAPAEGPGMTSRRNGLMV